MAARESSFGMWHPTVVPTNFEPTESVDDKESVDKATADEETVGENDPVDEPSVDSE